jgi:FlaA1/EpsC-like NDP-sugar epimerase
VRLVDLAADLVALSGAPAGSIATEFTGLRPGEKLSEALWEPASEVAPTGRGDVLRVREGAPEPGGEALAALVRRLAAAAGRGDVGGIHGLLAGAIPTFTSSLRPTARP